MLYIMKKTKMQYASPESEVLELRLEGIIATSYDASDPSITPPFSGETDW